MIFMKLFSVIRKLVIGLLFTLTAFNAMGMEFELPEPVSNNAVTIADIKGQPHLFSFAGLSIGKTFKDIHARAFSVNLKTGEGKVLASLPDGLGRLASIAVTVNHRIYVIGGYTVSADHSEVSTPHIYQYLPDKDTYQLITNMPTPVDDTVALVYQNRYIYLVSGWFNSGNVSLVQVFDTVKNRWFNATSFPGAAVFGHAGGIVANQMLIADGVKIKAVVDGKNQYGSSDENWIGVINNNDPAVIVWTKINKHPFSPLYRMASVGLSSSHQIMFAGGSDNPYNYNGIGYDKQPSQPSEAVFSYDLKQSKWLIHSPLPRASMDHRGMLVGHNRLYIAGGMGDNQQVLATIQSIPLAELSFNKESK